MKILNLSIIALLWGLASCSKCHTCQSNDYRLCPPTESLIDCGSKGCISICSVPAEDKPSCSAMGSKGPGRNLKTESFYFRGCLDPKEISEKLIKGDDGMQTLNEYCYEDGCNDYNFVIYQENQAKGV